MSSLRNAVPNRPYRERPQPLSRQRAGHTLLEKHKDYSLRAADHNAKRQRLKLLREKASARNPDEFAFGMMRARTAGSASARASANRGGADELEGRARDDVAGAGALKHDTAKLLKMQDAGYLRTVRGRVRGEIARLRGALQVLERGPGKAERGALRVLGGGEGVGPRHTVFVEGEAALRGFDAVEHFGTVEGAVGRSWNRPRRDGGGVVDEDAEEEEEEEVVEDGGASRAKKQQQGKWETERESQAFKNARRESQKRERDQERRRERLAALERQEHELGIAERELELQRARMNGDVGGVNKNGVKWKVRERKR